MRVAEWDVCGYVCCMPALRETKNHAAGSCVCGCVCPGPMCVRVRRVGMCVAMCGPTCVRCGRMKCDGVCTYGRVL